MTKPIVTQNTGGTGAGGMPPVVASQKTIACLGAAQAQPETFGPEQPDTTSTSITVPTILPPLDEATAAAVEQTRVAFFRIRAAGAANRIKQGELLLLAQAQLAKYGSGTFTAMLLEPRPAGFGFKSATSAYDLMDEAKGKPKRSHRRKGGGADSTPGRSNEAASSPVSVEGETAPADDDAQLPMNVEGEVVQSEECAVPQDLPLTLDTAHTHVYAPFPFKGVYVPKADHAGFTAWLKKIPHAVLSCHFLAWYQAENLVGEEVSDEANPTIQ
jgi:hypothetical protein